MHICGTRGIRVNMVPYCVMTPLCSTLNPWIWWHNVTTTSSLLPWKIHKALPTLSAEEVVTSPVQTSIPQCSWATITVVWGLTAMAIPGNESCSHRLGWVLSRHWKLGVVMMPTLSSLVPPVMTKLASGQLIGFQSGPGVYGHLTVYPIEYAHGWVVLFVVLMVHSFWVYIVLFW